MDIREGIVLLMFFIQKMPGTPKNTENYFRYFATPPEADAWGLSVTAAGFTRIPPGSRYPATAHPDDHALDWEKGRVLDALQIVLVIEGRGRVETRQTGLLEIGAGAAFALLPGVWHRYQPCARTGWVESWLEMRGPVARSLVARKIVDAARPVRANAFATEMEAALRQVHAHSRKNGAAFDPTRTAAAYAVLAAWEQARHAEGSPRTRLARVVGELEHILAERYTEPLDLKKLARSLGVAYSHLRQAFKEHTGYAPWQYVINLRMARARRLLASSDATLGEIAQQLGFSSSFHLSTMFKKTHGVSPRIWYAQSQSRGGRN